MKYTKMEKWPCEIPDGCGVIPAARGETDALRPTSSDNHSEPEISSSRAHAWTGRPGTHRPRGGRGRCMGTRGASRGLRMKTFVRASSEQQKEAPSTLPLAPAPNLMRIRARQFTMQLV